MSIDRLQDRYKPGKLYKVIDDFILNNEGATKEENPTFTRKTYRTKIGEVFMLTKITRENGGIYDSIDDVWYRFFFLVGQHEFSALYLDNNDECGYDFSTCFVEHKG